MIQQFTLVVIALLLVACGGAQTSNPTAYPYQINTELMEQTEISSVVIAHVNLGGTSRKYLQVHEARIDKMVERYLEEQGIKVEPSREFEQLWKKAVRVYGNPIDPTSGKINQKTFALIIINVRDELRKSSKVDAFVFTDLIEQQVAFSGGLKHLARWDGVSRKPTLQGPGDGVSADFNWNRQAKAVSLRVSIYDMELKALFSSMGGLDTTEAIDTRSSSGKFVRRRSILENESHLEEGIELAFHPFIVMKDYPTP